MARDRIRLYDDNDEEIVLPMHWEICSQCRGEGKSSAYLGAFTQSEWEEWDYEERDDYLSGECDRECDACDGTGKIEVVDYDRLSPELQERFDDACAEENSYRRMCEMERRMGA